MSSLHYKIYSKMYWYIIPKVRHVGQNKKQKFMTV